MTSTRPERGDGRLLPTTLARPYQHIQLIRRSLGFRILSARKGGDGRPCILVTTSGPDGDGRGRAALERAAEAHASFEHHAVPRTNGLHDVEGRPVLELDGCVVSDGVELMRRIAHDGERIPYAAADGFIVGLRVALQAAHRVRDPRTGGPLCLGRISNANVLFGPDGRSYLVGFGHNFPVEDPSGNVDPTIPSYVAAEHAMGAPPSPSGDYVALLALLRAGISLVDTTGTFRKILEAIANRGDEALLELLLWVERRVMSALPGARASIEESVETADRIRRLLKVVPDPDGFARLAARVLGPSSVHDAVDPRDGRAPRLVVGPEATWVRWGDDGPHRLRGPMRRILLALLDNHALGTSAPMPTGDLLEIGWPDERADHASMLNRSYVTMNRLRKILPEGTLERFDDGYRIHPDVRVHQSSHQDAPT